MQLKRFGLNPLRIHHIFISHLHGDHVFGIFGLLSTLALMGRKKAMHLHGPAELKVMMLSHFRFFGELPYELHFHVPDSEQGALFYEDEKLRVHSLSLKHRVTSFGYLFREKQKELNVRREKIFEYGLGLTEILKLKRGEDLERSDGQVLSSGEMTHPPFLCRSYAYLSDTCYMPELAKHVQGVDLLFHETTFMSKDEKLARATLHSTSTQAAMLAKDAGVGKLLMGHFSNRYRSQDELVEEARAIFAESYAVKDGECYSLPLERMPG